MVDLASMIGGDSVTTVDGADPSGAWAYFWNEGENALELGAEGDQLYARGNDGDLTVFGGSGDDTILSGKGDDEVRGGRDDDEVDGGRGDDEVRGGRGDDEVRGGRGEDEVRSGLGEDEADGGDDEVRGGRGGDEVDGGDGDDTLFGGGGDDTLIGGWGDDELHGGSGDDVFYFDSNFGSDVITDLSGGDEIWLKADLNNSGISSAADVADHVTGGVENGVSYTLISIGGDTIRIENMDADAFKVDISTWVKIQ
jgi:Ca2+-binding RTX toxin-like protein